jgi:phage gp36-like protein
MPYSVQADLEGRWGRDALLLVFDIDLDGDLAGTPDQAAIDAAIADADAEIDSYIGAKYPLPLADTPPALVRVSADLAMFHGTRDEHAMTELKEKRYDNAIRLLKDLSTGKADLGLSVSVATQGTGAATVVGLADGRLFTRENMDGL